MDLIVIEWLVCVSSGGDKWWHSWSKEELDHVDDSDEGKGNDETGGIRLGIFIVVEWDWDWRKSSCTTV